MKRIDEIELQMSLSGFWSDSVRAQATISEYQKLLQERDSPESLKSNTPFDNFDAQINISAGAGGDDSEDFVAILLRMYQAFAQNSKLSIVMTDSSPNELAGYRSLSLRLSGFNAFRSLQYETGVHRLIRISPFNAKGKRQTSFVLVEVLPVLERDTSDIILSPQDIDIQFTKSGGKGGQNVNKRETAVRITHKSTGLISYADGQRTQEANRETAMTMLRGKIALQKITEYQNQQDRLRVGNSIENEWGSQIRSYTLHPYTLVKDHRTGIETSSIQRVLEKGEIAQFTSLLY